MFNKIIFKFLFSLFGLLTALPASANSLVPEPAIVGTTPTSFDIAQGEVAHSVPIAVAPGRAGLQPNLSLVYTSKSTNDYLGVGWQLAGIPVISRCGATVAQDGFKGGISFDSNDRFCLDGQRLVEYSSGASSTIYRTEIDSYAKIEALGNAVNPTSFVMYTKEGLVYTFNESLSTQDGNLQWFLGSVTDRTNNTISFDYLHNGNRRYLQTITYAGGRVSFSYRDRQDTTAFYREGLLQTNRKVLNKITAYGTQGGEEEFRSYDISYKQSSESGRSLLEFIQECVSQDCLAPIFYTWGESENTFDVWNSASLYELDDEIFNGYNLQRDGDIGPHERGVRFNDVNGDGLLDMLQGFYRSNDGLILRTYINGGGFWDKSSSEAKAYAPPAPFYNFSNEGDQGTHLVDLNGDGLVDILRATPKLVAAYGFPKVEAYINTGSGWEADTALSDSYADVLEEHEVWLDDEGGAKLIDLNGDGLVDILTGSTSRFLPNGGWDNRAYINTGSGWDFESELAIAYGSPIILFDGNWDHWVGTRFVDLNGDGLVDILRGYNHAKDIDIRGNKVAVLNTGSGWDFESEEARNYIPPLNFFNTHQYWDRNTDGGVLVDINGDGLVDLIRRTGTRSIYDGTIDASQGGTNDIWINTGNGWLHNSLSSLGSTYRLPTLTMERYDTYVAATSNEGTRFVDINMDGLVDILNSSERRLNKYIEDYTWSDAWLNKGLDGWLEDSNYASPVIFTEAASNVQQGSSILDLNGDGRPDVLRAYRDYPVSSVTGNKEMTLFSSAYINKAKSSTKVIKGDQLSVIEQGNNKIKITYRSLAQLAEDNKYDPAEIPAVYPSVSVSPTIPVVTEVRRNVDQGSELTTTYRYQGFKFDMQGRGSLGFEKITEDTRQTAVTVEKFYQQNFPFTGRLKKVIKKAQRNPVEVIENVYSVNLSSGIYHVHDRTSTTSFHKGNLVYKAVVVANNDFDNYGNPRETSITHSEGSQNYIEKIEREFFSHVTDSNRWAVNLLKTETVQYSSPNQPSTFYKRSFSYKPYTYLLSSSKVLSNSTGTTLLTLSFEYDQYGRIVSEKASAEGYADRVSTLSYANNKTGPVLGCDSSGVCTYFGYDHGGRVTEERQGVSKNEYDSLAYAASGISTHWTYDRFGRLSSETRDQGGSLVVRRDFANNGYCLEYPASDLVYACEEQAFGDGNVSVAMLDRLDRVIRTVTKGLDGRLVFQDNQYNNLGQPVASSRPYFEGERALWLTQSFDSQGRVIERFEPAAHGDTKQVSIEYDGLVTTSYSGPDRLESVVQVDPLGRIVFKQEEESSYVEYKYTSDGNPQSTIVSGRQSSEIKIQYDEFGRKERLLDPDSGTTHYTYTPFGEVETTTDAKGQVTRYAYDTNGRQQSLVSLEGSSAWAFGGQDANVGERGQLVGSSGLGLSKVFSYDTLGRLDTAEFDLVNDSASYRYQYRYDQEGRITRTNYPGSKGFFTENLYNEHGFLNAVRGRSSVAEEHDVDRLLPLVSQALDLANEYQDKAERLRFIGQYYESVNSRISGLGVVASIDREVERGDFSKLVSGTGYKVYLGAGTNYYVEMPHENGQPPSNHYRIRHKTRGDDPGFYVYSISHSYFQDRVHTFTDTGDLLYVREDVNYRLYCACFSQSYDEYQSELADHRAYLLDLLDEGADVLTHIGNTIKELEEVVELINLQADNYERGVELLIQLTEQTLANVNHQSNYSRHIVASAESYSTMIGDEAYTYYWQATATSAAGRVTSEVYGNGIANYYQVDPATGLLQSIHSGVLSLMPVRHLEYQYDAYNNVISKHDVVNDIQESFQYDRQDRVTNVSIFSPSYTFSSALNNDVALDYDELGNIVFKSDVGNYEYGSAGPHAVTRASDKNYHYDANGNMTSGNGRTIQYASFNKPTFINKSGEGSVRFSYDAEHQRYKMVDHLYEVTHYVGDLYEKVQKGSSIKEKHYIYANGDLVAEHIALSGKANETRYLHKDALGNVDLITDGLGNVVDRRSFDPWGKLREFPWEQGASLSDPLYLTQLPFTNKGFGGHEHLQEVGLIHMNGRVFDPELGRFISADPYISKPMRSGSYNRYSYVMNNPMKYIDPTGYAGLTIDWDDPWGLDDDGSYSNSETGESFFGGTSTPSSESPSSEGDSDSGGGSYPGSGSDQSVYSGDGANFFGFNGTFTSGFVSIGELGYSESGLVEQQGSTVSSGGGQSNFGVGTGDVHTGISGFSASSVSPSVLQDAQKGQSGGSSMGPAMAAAIPMAGVLAASDGPAPIGDLLGGALVLGALVVDESVKIHLTYTLSTAAGVTYVGRTSGYGDPHSIMMRRFNNHHMRALGFGNPTIDAVAAGITGRIAIRGREQQKINSLGGVGSPFVGNRIRGVSRANPLGRVYHEASSEHFGEIADYDGLF